MKLYCMPRIYALGPLIVPREFAIPASLLTAFQHVAARAARRPPRTDPSTAPCDRIADAVAPHRASPVNLLENWNEALLHAGNLRDGIAYRHE